MTLAYFNNTPLSTATQMGQNDYFIGDGSTVNFTLVNNTFITLANTVQVENSYFTRSGGGVTGSGSLMTLSSAPAVNADVVAPNSNYGYLSAYDRPVTGVSNSQVVSGVFHLADIADIETQYYQNAPGLSGIESYFTQRITSGGALPSWFQFAPLNVDMSINTSAWGSAGSPLYMAHPFSGASTLNGSVSSGATSIVLTSASGFYAGQWIKISDGGNSDIVWIESISSNTLNIVGGESLGFSHANGVNVFSCGSGVGIQMTVPLYAGGGIPLNLFNCSLDSAFEAIAR
jgi:hypothetical protein